MLRALAALSIALLCGCGAAVAPNARPKVLRLHLNPSADDIQLTRNRYAKLRDYLSQTLNMPVELVETSGYGPTIEAMRANKIDVSTIGPVAYLIAVEKAGAEALVVPGRADGPITYQSCIIVRQDSPIQTLAELLRDSSKYTFAFVDPASASGHLIPRAYLEGQGFDAEKGFRKMFFSTGHPTSVYTVLGGKVDAAATMPGMLYAMKKAGKLKDGELRILWESPPIPTAPIMIRKALPEDFKNEVRQAYLNLHKTSPELAQTLQATTNYPDYRYLPATDSMYDVVRAIARDLKKVKILD